MKGPTRSTLFAGAMALAPLVWGQGATSFMQQAAETNIAEQEMAEVAEERAASKGVKEYAEHMKEEHERANEKLQSIAEKKGVELPDEPNEQHKQQAERLSKLQGPAFDQAYIKSQIEAHEKTIKSFEEQAKTAEDPEVKQYAEQTLTTLREHLKQAQQLQRQAQRGAAGQSKQR